ncbi:MAG: DNA-binding response regulator [Verrucomicrobia bacterium]|jgi:DNA-binding NarL/FixJ family response regulator|nr:DNA-binding response regulator [Verrucomicrobiota bacterium]
MKTSLRKIRVSRPAAHPTFPLAKKPPVSSSPDAKKRVLVIEDQSAVCDLVAEMIHAHPRCVSVGTASDGQSAIEMALRLRPDILVLDVIMPGVGGIEVLRRLGGSLPATKVLIFSGKQEPHIVRALMQAGIHGFVNKNGPLSELRKALEAVALGNTWFNEDFSRTVRQALASPAHLGEGMIDQLTPREREIAVLIAQSHSSKEVAGRLNISIKTAENHRANLMRKLGVRDVAGLVRFVVRQGLVDPAAE